MRNNQLHIIKQKRRHTLVTSIDVITLWNDAPFSEFTFNIFGENIFYAISRFAHESVIWRRVSYIVLFWIIVLTRIVEVSFLTCVDQLYYTNMLYVNTKVVSFLMNFEDSNSYGMYSDNWIYCDYDIRIVYVLYISIIMYICYVYLL